MSRHGVLLVGHGTRDQNGTKQFFQLADVLQSILPDKMVQPCLLEFQEPTIPQGWDSLARKGVSHITVSPLLLFAAGHAKSDIPDVIASCQQRTPQITYNYSIPLSRCAALVDHVCNRITQAIAELPSHESVSLVMVGRGSHDPCAKADMQVLSQIAARRIGVENIATAFYAMAEPKLEDVLDQTARRLRDLKSNLPNSIVVHPHLLFDGRLYQAINKQVEQLRESHPQLVIRLSSYLGPDHKIAEAVATRLAQANDSSVTASTQYRTKV